MKIGDRVKHKTLSFLKNTSGIIVDFREPLYIPFFPQQMFLDYQFIVLWDNSDSGESDWLNESELELIKEHLQMNYFETLDHLITLNKEHRAKYLDASKTMSSASFAAQFQTVRCYIGRQIGSSTYINEHATENDLIIVSKMGNKSFYQNKALVLSFSEVEEDSRGRLFENIYVNEPTFLFNLVRDDKFYTLLAKNTEQTFILLGS